MGILRTLIIVMLLCGVIAPAAAQSPTIFPVGETSNGNVYYNGNVDTNAYIGASNGDLWGDLHFANFDSSSYGTIKLELTRYGMSTVFPSYVSLYGFGSNIGPVVGGDYAAPAVLIQTLPITSNPTDGQEFLFDVTDFVRSTTKPYLVFLLHSADRLITFGSTRYNLGTPPQLVATPVPEPSALALLCLGGIGLLARRRSRIS